MAKVRNISHAEGVRFELTVGFPTAVFKTAALDHYATPPLGHKITPVLKTYKGVVQKGMRRGGALGFPTVNIPLKDDVSGIFAARVVVGGRTYKAAAFADATQKILEAHIFDTKIDLYGKEIQIELHQKIRESTSFESDDALRAAIGSDVKKVREYFRADI